MSLCATCQHLEVWPKVFGGTRYWCPTTSFTIGLPKEFGKFGYDTVKGTPPVKKCDKYENGCHYSRRKR